MFTKRHIKPIIRPHDKHQQAKHKLQKLGRESMEEMVRREGEKHPGGG